MAVKELSKAYFVSHGPSGEVAPLREMKRLGDRVLLRMYAHLFDASVEDENDDFLVPGAVLKAIALAIRNEVFNGEK